MALAKSWLNVGSDNDLVQLGNKPLTEPLLHYSLSPHGITRSY